MLEVFKAFSNDIYTLSLVMARIYPCLVLIPVFNFKVIRGFLRSAIIVCISLIALPIVDETYFAQDHTLLSYAFLYFKEIIVGMFLGIVLAMPFWLFESVGSMLDNQRGALAAGQINPVIGQDSSPIGQMLMQFLIIVLIISGSFYSMLTVIWESYLLWPATTWFPVPEAEGFNTYLGLLASTFKQFILYAAPLVAILLFVEFGLALISVFSPQLNVFILSMPAKSLIGLLFLVLYLPTLLFLGETELEKMSDLNATLKLFFLP